MKLFLLCLASCFLVLGTHAQTGRPDSTFNGKGFVSLLENPRNIYNESSQQVLWQDDGRLLVLLGLNKPGVSSLVARFGTTGVLDQSFGSGGYFNPFPEFGAAKIINNTNYGASAVKLSGGRQADGKIVIVGSTSTYQDNGAGGATLVYLTVIRRLNADGTPDNSFLGGVPRSILPGTNFTANSVLIQPDHKILLSGTTYGSNMTRSYLSVVRLNADGSPDTGFANGGVGIVPSPYAYNTITQAALQNDGKIVAVGTANNGAGETAYLIARYSANGSSDNMFGFLGVNRIVPSATRIAVQPDNKILLGGGTSFARFSSSGTQEWVVTTNFNITDLALQPDGKIVAGGSIFIGTDKYTGASEYDAVVARYSDGGGPDNTFNGTGRILLPHPEVPYVNTLNSLLVQPDGKIAVAQTAGISIQQQLTDYGVARINANGTLDNSFNGTGLAQAYIPGFQSGVGAVAVQPDGKVLTGGNRMLYRFLPNGAPDAGFSGDGKLNLALNTSGDAGQVTAIQVLADGRILVGGSVTEFNNIALLRYNPDGTPDNTFNGTGVLTTNGGGRYSSPVQSMLVQPDGKIVVAGTVSAGETSYASALVLRFNPDGSPDNSFHGTGVVVLPLASDSTAYYSDEVHALSLQPDGKILVAGGAYVDGVFQLALVRLNTDGTPDGSFSGDGKQFVSFPGRAANGFSISAAPDGRIAVAGSAGDQYAGSYFVLASFLADGTPDATAPGNGKLLVETIPFKQISNIQPVNGQWILAGTVSNITNDDLLIARFNADGSVDNAFGTGGKFTADFGQFDLSPAIALSGTRLYAAETNSASSFAQTDNSGLLAAFLPAAAPSTASGLQYRYYEGAWDNLPDFSKLTPVKTGNSANIDLSVRPAGRNTDYGLVWEGFINLPKAGDYTFETASDDGSKFYFNTTYSPEAQALVNNDGQHGLTVAKGTIHVDAPGLYPVAITFFQRSVEATVQLYWTGPGIPRQPVPDAAFTDAYQLPGDNTAPSQPGNLRSAYTGRTFADLAWDASTDNIGVAGYEVTVDGQKKYLTTGLSLRSDSLSPNTTHTFGVRAFDVAGNFSAGNDPLQLTTNASGLRYRYYKGGWDQLPNFNLLTPAQTGASANADLSVRSDGAPVDYGFIWEGWINIKTAGDYRFSTTSDDGSALYFNRFYAPDATPLVNNDGQHGLKTVSGTVHVDTPGLYPVAITFFQRSVEASLQLSWSGPGIVEQRIPDAAFTEGFQLQTDTIAPSAPANLRSTYTGRTFAELAWTASADNIGVTGYDVFVDGVKKSSTGGTSVRVEGLSPNAQHQFQVKAFDLAGNRSASSNSLALTTAANGLKYSYYEGEWITMPDFKPMIPVQTGTSRNADINVRPAYASVNYAFLWEGYINIPAAGDYTFETISDDGSKFYFNSFYVPNQLPLVNNDGEHGLRSVQTTIHVDAPGLYPVAISFFQHAVAASMELYWTGPGIARQLVPDAAFTENFTVPVPAARPSATIRESTGAEKALQLRAYPTPFQDRLTLSFNNPVNSGPVQVYLYDQQGRQVYSERFAQLPGGPQTLTLGAQAGRLPAGWYTVSLSANRTPLGTVRLFKTVR